MRSMKKCLATLLAMVMLVCVSSIQVSAAETPVLGVYIPATDETVLAPEGMAYQYKPSVVVYDDGSVLVEIVARDANGKIVSDLWADSQVWFFEYQLDEMGNRVREDAYIGNQYYMSANYAYEYNELGMVSYKYQMNQNGEICAMYEYEYDVNGALISLLFVTSDYQALYEFTYNQAGDIQTTTVYDSNDDVYQTSYAYDEAGRLTTVVKDGEGIDSLFITYDAAGNVVEAKTYSYLYGNGDYTSMIQYMYNQYGMLELLTVQDVNAGQATYKILY